MIEELHIRGLGVIEDTSIALGPGLTVVTGETGAGKTMLVTALQLLLGARASSDLVRRGRDAAVIEAVVRLPANPPGWTETDPDGTTSQSQALAELWDLAEDGALIISREIPIDGRSRARVGGRLVPTSLLAALLAPHVEVHGQHEHVRLEDPTVQRRLLDGYGDHDHTEILRGYRDAYASWSEARRREQLLQEDATARNRRLDQLLAERDEIDGAALDPARDESLDQEIDRLANADALRSAIEAAHAAAGSGGALDGISAAVTALQRAPIDDRELIELTDRLVMVSRELSETVADLAAFAVDTDADGSRLDALQVRKREVTMLRRRFGPSVAAILEHREAVAAEAADLAALQADAAGIAAAVATARATLDAAADALSDSRRCVGERLTASVAEHLAELGLEHATLTVALTPCEPGPEGADRVELLLAANPGERPARIADAASGGERSRVALALEVVLAADRGSGVLVFDEVDAGIGGSTALAVGSKMRRLTEHGAGSRQVLCVTHLAQVAAYADTHHVVEKSVRDGRTVTSVRRLEEQERPEALSRMLGGEATAEAGLQHARGLLASARVGGSG